MREEDIPTQDTAFVVPYPLHVAVRSGLSARSDRDVVQVLFSVLLHRVLCIIIDDTYTIESRCLRTGVLAPQKSDRSLKSMKRDQKKNKHLYCHAWSSSRLRSLLRFSPMRTLLKTSSQLHAAASTSVLLFSIHPM